MRDHKVLIFHHNIYKVVYKGIITFLSARTAFKDSKVFGNLVLSLAIIFFFAKNPFNLSL